jgi:hypothetical protein
MHDKFLQAQEKVSWDNLEHEDLFRRLWKALKQDPFPGRKDNKWKDLGFQGADPQTDFRGAGVLALEALVYWAEKHRRFAKDLVSVQDQRTYPLCTAGINCISLTMKLLAAGPNAGDGLAGGIPKFELETVRNSDLFQLLVQCPPGRDNFFEMFVMLLRFIDQFQVAMNAGYLDFPKVVSAVENEVRIQLRKEPCDLTTLQQWVKPRVIN